MATKTKPLTLPARRQRDNDYKKKQRAANRTWLRSQGWERDAEALVTAARRGEVVLRIEIVEKDEE